MSLRTWSFVLAGVLTLGSLTVLVSLSATGPATARGLLSVELVTDRLQPVAQGVVSIDDGLHSYVVTTTQEGQSPWRDLDSSSGYVDIVIAEMVSVEGIGLGMSETVPLPFQPAAGQDALLVTVSRTQPLAVPVAIDGSPSEVQNIFPPSGDYPHWRIATPIGSGLAFNAHVASLLDAQDVRRFTDYRGHDFAPSLQYVRGVDLVMPAAQLGTEGILIGVDLLGDLASGVTVDLLNFMSLPSVIPIGEPLGASIHSVHNGVVYVRVTGGVARGHLTLLVRASGGPPATVERVVDAPPVITVPPGAGDGVDHVLLDQGPGAPVATEDDAATAAALAGTTLHGSVLATDCEPEVPNTPRGWSCEPAAPAPNACGAATSDSEAQCHIVRSRTPLICRNGGSTFAVQQARTASWKVTFDLTGGGNLGPLSSTGGFEYGEEGTTTTTEGWTAEDGEHGEGQCMRYFRFELVCAKAFKLKCSKLVWDPDEEDIVLADCAFEQTTNRVCRDSSWSQNVCDRTP